MRRVFLLAVLSSFGLALSEGVPLHQYEYGYLVSSPNQVSWVDPRGGFIGTPAEFCARMGQPQNACELLVDRMNVLGAQGWFPVSLTPAPGGQVYFYREVR